MNDNLIKRIIDFTETVLMADNHSPLAKQVKSAVEKQLKLRQSATNPILEPAPPDSVEESPLEAQGLAAYSEEEIADQLTLIDFNLYSAIKPVELLNQAWNKESLKHRAPNVLAMIHRFNNISLWAASEILFHPSIKERVAMYVRLVNVTEHLFKLNNFNTALAIISGLNNSGIYRLKYTRAELPKKVQMAFDNGMQLMNSDGAYKAYRESLHNVNPPCVPYLGVYLTDLTFIEDGNRDFINELINFRKRQLVFDVIAELQLHQQLGYSIQANEKLLSLLQNLPCLKEDQLYQMSLLREPRNADRADIA